MRNVKKALALAALIACGHAQAVVQDIAGANYSYDTGTSLYWLDPVATLGLSFNQVQQGAFIASGWRYATGAELNSLFAGNLTAYTNMPIAADPSVGRFAGDFNTRGVDYSLQISSLVVSMGGPTAQTFGQAGSFALSGIFDRQVDTEEGSAHAMARLNTNGPDTESSAGFGGLLLDARGSFNDHPMQIGGTGHWLVSSTIVSPVPEPSTYAMMGLGLAMVGWVARRRAS